MVFRHALKNGKSFAEMTQILVNNKNLSRASAETVAFTNMDEYGENEMRFRRGIYTGMGLKNSSKVLKILDKMN